MSKVEPVCDRGMFAMNRVGEGSIGIMFLTISPPWWRFQTQVRVLGAARPLTAVL